MKPSTKKALERVLKNLETVRNQFDAILDRDEDLPYDFTEAFYELDSAHEAFLRAMREGA